MGRGWDSRPKGGRHAGTYSGSEHWDYWSGTWSPRLRGKAQETWYPEGHGTAFPAYDDKDRVANIKWEGHGKGHQKGLKGPSPTGKSAALDEDPAEQMTSGLQDHINLTRKAEQKVRSLQMARERKDALWQKFQEDMKQSWLKETARYNKAIEALDRDIAAAITARDEARGNIRQFFLNGPTTARPQAELEEGAMDWEAMTLGWQHEQQEAHASQAVLRRALQPPQTPVQGHPGHGVGGLMSPEAAAQLLMATMHGQALSGAMPLGFPATPTEPVIPDDQSLRSAVPEPNSGKEVPAPYVPSPSSRGPEASTSTSPTALLKPGSVPRSRNQPRMPIKGAPLQPVHTQTANSLANKLEARRTQLQSTIGEGHTEEGHIPPMAGQTDHAGKPASLLVDDDDNTEGSEDKPSHKPDGLDGLG